MTKRYVHWSEGMFLKPHHFQAAERAARERLKESEDWLHPHDWGIRSLKINSQSLANFTFEVLGCEARLKDGTTITIPEEAGVTPLDLRAALKSQPSTTVSLAIPAWQTSRGNVEQAGETSGARFGVKSLEFADENTGIDEESLDIRLINARLITSNLDVTGFELLPLARIRRGAGIDSAPELDLTYIPPLLGYDAWTPLHEDVEKFFQQLLAVVRQESDYLVGRKIAFDSQILGEAERILRLSTLNGAFSYFQGVLSTSSLHPLTLYGELCRLVGQLSLFDVTRRPIDIPGYDHDELGPCFARVLGESRRLLGRGPKLLVEKRYFQLEAKRFLVTLDQDWTLETAKLYIGIEASDLSDNEVDDLIRKTDWKLGSADQVAEIFKSAAEGLRLTPLSRIPPELPRGSVYFDINRNPEPWRDVLRSLQLGLRFPVERLKYKDPKTFTLISPRTAREVDLKFAVYVVKPS